MDARLISEVCNLIATLIIGIVIGMIIGYETWKDEN
jgi:ABC-type dipeptide/oligopeptide/nickel transport system permease subunit